MKKLWISFAVVLLGSFAILGWIGTRIYQQMLSIPARVLDTSGAVVVAEGDIGRGQNVWQARGGMELGSIWGHGSYVAPDWAADYLHREAEDVLDQWSRRDYRQPYAQLESSGQAALRDRLQKSFRANTYDPARGTVVVDPARATA